jgi:putative membrane protein
MPHSSIRPGSLLAALASAMLVLSACNRSEDLPAPTTTGSADGTTTTASRNSLPPSSDSAVTTAANTPPAGTSPADLIANEPTSAGPAAEGSGASTLSAADRSFLTEAAGSGLYEVAVAKLAADKATDPAIKSYAAMLLDHHSKANDKLKAVAQNKGVAVPTEIPASKQRKIDALSKVSGADFDRQFIREVGIHDHKNDIALFEKASKDSKDSAVRSFAESTLPTLREHLGSAEKLPAKTGSGS